MYNEYSRWIKLIGVENLIVFNLMGQIKVREKIESWKWAAEYNEYMLSSLKYPANSVFRIIDPHHLISELSLIKVDTSSKLSVGAIWNVISILKRCKCQYEEMQQKQTARQGENKKVSKKKQPIVDVKNFSNFHSSTYNVQECHNAFTFPPFFFGFIKF